MYTRFLLLIIAFLSFGVVIAQPYIIDNQNIANQSFLLHPNAKVYDLKEKVLSIDEFMAQKEKLSGQVLNEKITNTGFTSNYYWMEFLVNNNTNSSLNYYLETTRPITDFVYLYTKNGTQNFTKQQSGDAIPFESRDFKNHKSIFKITLPPNQITHYYLNFKSDGEVVSYNLKLHTADDFIYTSSTENLFYGIFYGILFLAAITYLFFYFALRDKSFLYYSLYVITIGLMQFSLDGFWFQYFGPNASIYSQKAVIIFAALGTLFFGLYGKTFLKITSKNKVLNMAYRSHAALVLGLTIVVVLPFTIPTFSYVYINTLALAALLLVIISVINTYIIGKPTDKFFAIGIAALTIGMTVFILNNFGIIHSTFFTENSSKFGTGTEVIFLSLSMSNLIRKLRSEKELAQNLTLKKSEDMNELKSYFMNNMSHELRTPLNAIMGIADVMLNEEIEPKVRSNFEIIKYSSIGLLSSVNDILDFNKIEKGELTLNSVTFEPKLLLEQIKHNTQNQATDKGLTLLFEINSNLPFQIQGDPVRFIQIVNNVVNNAIKFTNSGWIKVTIDTINKNNDTAELQITVSDSGVGIPQEKLTSIYESFMQESITNTRKYGGLGLGLSIVKKLIELHHGNITIESKIGVGTTCVLTIPFTIILNEPIIVPAAPIIEPLVSNKNLNVLIVEDNTINQLLMKMILKKWDNTTFAIANDGAEALEKMKAELFDVVLMDLQMPIMDGYEATIAIREGKVGAHYLNVPIIAITADVMDGTAKRVEQIGMNAYLTKPVNQQVLFETVMKHTQQKESVLV